MRRPALWLSVGVAVLAAAGVATFAYANRAEPVPAASTTARVQRGIVTQSSTAAGTVQPVGSRGLSFSTGGVVTELDVKPGDTVNAGQVLARMDSSAVADEGSAAQSSVDSANDALSRTGSSGTGSSGTCVTPAGWHSPQPSPSASPSPTATASPSASSPGSAPSGSTSPAQATDPDRPAVGRVARPAARLVG